MSEVNILLFTLTLSLKGLLSFILGTSSVLLNIFICVHIIIFLQGILEFLQAAIQREVSSRFFFFSFNQL